MNTMNVLLVIALITMFVILIPLSVPSTVKAQGWKAAYLVLDNHHIDQNIIDAAESVGFDVDTYSDDNIPSINFSDYDVVMIGDGPFSNYNLIPVNQMPCLIMNGYHVSSWHWSKKISQVVSNYPLRAHIVDPNHFISENLTDPIQVYTQAEYSPGGPGIPMFYLSKYTIAYGLYVVISTMNFDRDGVIATALPGTQLRDGVVSNSKGAFYGIWESDYWTDDSEELFKRTLLWLVREEVAPEINITSPGDNSYYNTTNILVEYSVSEESSCEYSIDGSPRQSINSGDYINVEEGTHNLTIYCTDDFGNTGSSTVTFTVDTTQPSVVIIEPQQQYYDTDSILINVSASDNDGIKGCYYILNNGAEEPLVFDNGYWTSQVTVQEGSNDLVVYCLDYANNKGSDNTSFVVDLTLPVINDVYHNPEEPTELDSVVVFANITEENVDSVLLYYRINSNSWSSLIMSYDTNTGLWNVDMGSFNIDDFVEYFVSVNDSAGHTVTSQIKNFTVKQSDTTPPNMPKNIRAYWQDGSVVIEWEVPDGEVPAYYNIYISDNPYAEISSFDFEHPNVSTTNLNWTDTSASEVRRRFYIVRSVDSFDNEDNNTFRFGKFDLDIRQGMNLVSLPLEPFDTSICSVMHESPSYKPIVEVMKKQGDNNYAIATFYDQNPPCYWWSADGLDELSINDAYWFKATTPENFTIVGKVVTQQQSINLNPGMQLVGYTSLYDNKLWDIINQDPSDYAVEEVMLRNNNGQYSIATYYSNNPPNYWWSADGFDTLKPGVGYWFKLNKNFIWTYNPE